jgi:hypothetical protein
MKSLILLLLLVSPVYAQVTDTHDEFTGARGMNGTIVVVPNTGAYTTRMMAMHSGGMTYVVMTVTADTWVHLKDDEAYAIHGNGTRLNITTLKVDSEVERSGSSVYTIEIIAFRLPTHNIQNPLKIRLSGIVYTVPESVVADVKTIGARLR